MNSKIFLFLAILLIVAGTLFFWPSDEKKIKGNLDSLAEYSSSAKEEPLLETLKKASQTAQLCTDLCKVQFESLKIDREFSRKEFTDHFLMMKKRLPNTDFSFHDTVINVEGDNRADITTTLRINGEIIDEWFTDAYEMNITANKKEGDWRFSSFTVVEFMKK
jgi:hypothetical protein